MGFHKVAQDSHVSGTKEWSTLLKFSGRSSTARTEHCPPGVSKLEGPRQPVKVCDS